MTDERPSLDDATIAAIARRIDRPIVLVGLMGAGKSTVGKRLATILGTSFVDADSEIEAAAQMSVAEMFEHFGEDYFRDGERRVIARLISEHFGVIATGGGAFVNDETRALLLGKSIPVWIDCRIETLVERTGRKNTRPLLRDGDPEEILTRLHKERAPLYGDAPIHVQSGEGSHMATVTRILKELDAWL